MEANIAKLEARLRVWNAMIEKLAAKADKARGQARLDSQYNVDDLKAKRAVARARLSEYKAAGDELQDGFGVRLEIAWSDLENAFKELRH